VVGDSTVKRSVSIGVAASPEDGDDPDVLITQARGAARDASGRRRGGSKITAGQAAYDARRQIALGRRLAEAIGEQRIEPRYQPRLRVADGRIVGAEALARWEDEELGPVSPAEFIPVAERAGLIGDLTHAIMDAAVARASQWRAEGNADFRIGVNLSGADLLDPGLVDLVTDMLERREIGGDILELEITEGALVADIRRAERQMHALAELGVRFAIDDFGTGYSSFQYLRELPVDQVKVDRSFVRDIAGNANDAAILQAITAMAGALGLEVVAEGVEDAEQLRLLRAWRCNQAQGFLFAPAVPALRFGELLREGLTEAAPTS
jgi:EAL domain-containing protein (putative c-di-GMP-specific phosphodiesterase class I)